MIDILPPQAVEVVEHQVMKGWCWRYRSWRPAAVNWTGVVVGCGRVGIRLMGVVAYMSPVADTAANHPGVCGDRL